MGVPTNHDILILLDRLEHEVADDLETLWLDFKPWQGPKEDMRVAIECIAAFANAEGGVIVFGVADRTPGRAAAIHGAAGYDLDTWRRGLFDSVRPHLTVMVEELSIPEGTGRLLLVRVPKGTDPPYGTAQGLYKRRVGKNNMPMDAREFLRGRVSTGAVDWSGQPAEGVDLDDLDPVEIARARNVARQLRPESDLSKLSNQELLTGMGAVRGGQVTHTGMLLFGREDVLAQRCPQHLIQYTYQTSDTEVARNDLYRFGLLNVLDRIEQAFTGPTNPEQELSIGLYKLRIPAFPLEVVREAVLNAVTHRDYVDPGKVLIRHTLRELVVSSPGGFLADITPRNILRHEAIPRNPMLALAFVKLGLVESTGVGRKRIFVPMLSYGKRVPVYETDGVRVVLRIFDGVFDTRTAALVAQWRQQGREVDLDGLLVLSFLSSNAFIDTASAANLLQVPRDSARTVLDQLAQPKSGILERRGRTKAATYHLTKAVAKDLLGKAAYTKTRGLDPIRYAELARAFVADHGAMTPQECRELLGLGESKTARVEASRLLRAWSEGADAFLRREGKPPKVRYLPRAASP